MTSKVNIILGLFVSAFLFSTVSFTTSAQTVSSGDAVTLNLIDSPMLMSSSPVSTLSTEDYGIAVAGTVYPYSVPDGSVTFAFNPSIYSDTQTVSVKMFDIVISEDIEFGSASLFLSHFEKLTIQNYKNGHNLINYNFWGIVNGEKHIIDGISGWYHFASEFPFTNDVISFGIDLVFSPVHENLTDYVLIEPYAGKDGAYIIDGWFDPRAMWSSVEISWSGFEWDLRATGTTAYESINTLSDRLAGRLNVINNNLVSYFESLISSIGDWFHSLFDKLDHWGSTIVDKLDSFLDVLTTGYEHSSNMESVENADNAFSQFSEDESSVRDQASGYMDGYTISGEGAVGYAEQFYTVFPLISSMMQSIFVSAGSFGIIMSVMFTLMIVCMLVGMFRWYKS